VITLETSAHCRSARLPPRPLVLCGTAMATDSLLFSNTWSCASQKFSQMFLLFDYRISSNHVSSVCLKLVFLFSRLYSKENKLHHGFFIMPFLNEPKILSVPKLGLSDHIRQFNYTGCHEVKRLSTSITRILYEARRPLSGTPNTTIRKEKSCKYHRGIAIRSKNFIQTILDMTNIFRAHTQAHLCTDISILLTTLCPQLLEMYIVE
jgi:hypothetical protein